MDDVTSRRFTVKPSLCKEDKQPDRSTRSHGIHTEIIYSDRIWCEKNGKAPQRKPRTPAAHPKPCLAHTLHNAVVCDAKVCAAARPVARPRPTCGRPQMCHTRSADPDRDAVCVAKNHGRWRGSAPFYRSGSRILGRVRATPTSAPPAAPSASASPSATAAASPPPAAAVVVAVIVVVIVVEEGRP